MDSEWGRIAEDGTVYVRAGDGERVIGSWQAGTHDEGIAFYRKRYADLVGDVILLEGRAASPASDPKAVDASVRALRETLPTASAIGDLAALDARLAAIDDVLAGRRAQRAAERAAAAEQSADAKRALVTEAEKIAAGSDWRVGSERFRQIVEEWKAIHGVDRATDGELWAKFSAARRSFDARRKTHYADLDRERSAAAERKATLVRRAEKLADSTEWAATAKALRELMDEWKSSGRASREAEAELWPAFTAARDTFFTRRSEVFGARDAEQAKNLAEKQALLAEAGALDATADPAGARRRMASIHDRWEKVGHVPRDAMRGLEDQLGEIERRIRVAGAAARQVVVEESPIVLRLRESVGKLEARLERARVAGDDRLATETETSLSTQREWLAQAEAARH